MKKIFAILFLFGLVKTHAQTSKTKVELDVKYPLSQQLASTAMQLWKDSFALEGDKTVKWRYDQGVILKGIEGIWNATGDGKWINYIQRSMDFYVKEDGTIKGYKHDEYNIDHVNNGRLLLLLYRVSGK